MGGATSRSVPTYVRNYEALVARDALPGANKFFETLESTFMARAPSHTGTLHDIAALVKKIKPQDVLALKTQYADKAERVDVKNIRDSFVLFVSYLEIARVEIVVESVNDFILTRVLTQLFYLRGGTLKSIKIIAGPQHEERVNGVIANARAIAAEQWLETTPFYVLLKTTESRALVPAPGMQWMPVDSPKEGNNMVWAFALTRKSVPESEIIVLPYDVEAEADKLNNLIIASIEFFEVFKVVTLFQGIRHPIMMRWWDKYIKFVRGPQPDGSFNNDSVRKWTRNVNALMKSRGSRARIFAEEPFPREDVMESCTFSYQKDLGDMRIQYLGVLTLRKRYDVIRWDLDNRLSKIVDKFHAAFKVAVSSLRFKAGCPKFPDVDDVFKQWHKTYAKFPDALATDLTRFCAANPSNAPIFEWDIPRRPVITIERGSDNELTDNRPHKIEVLKIMVNAQHWGDIHFHRPEEGEFVISARPPFDDALTHEIAALIMRYDVDSAADGIPFYQDVISSWTIRVKGHEKEINEECELNGSVARIKFFNSDADDDMFYYYHGTTLVGELDFNNGYSIRWRKRPQGWEALKTTWRSV